MHIARQENPRRNAGKRRSCIGCRRLLSQMQLTRCGACLLAWGTRDPLNLGAAPEVARAPPVFWSPRGRRRALDACEARCRSVSRLASDRVFCALHLRTSPARDRARRSRLAAVSPTGPVERHGGSFRKSRVLRVLRVDANNYVQLPGSAWPVLPFSAVDAAHNRLSAQLHR